MKLSFAGERVLAVVAHPDDVELLCAGTLARAREDGAKVAVAALCLGDKGQTDPPIPDLAELRARELLAAAQLLEAEATSGWVPDSTLQDDAENRRVLVDLIRQFRPSLILGHCPQDYHADHRAASQLVDVCSWLATSRGYVTEHAVLEFAPAVWWMDSVGMHGFEPAFFIDVSRFQELKEQMLHCHESQLRRGEDTTFAPLLEIVRRQSGARGMQSQCAAAEAFQWRAAFKRMRAW